MALQDLLPHLVHVGALLYAVCFLFRDQLYLRLFAVLGDAIYSVYFLTLTEKPYWAIVYSFVYMAINSVMMMLIWRDRTETRLADRDLELYQSFTGMTPGDFRRLLKAGTWTTADTDRTLTSEAEKPDRLYYIVSGQVDIRKSGRAIPIAGKHFIGEIAYLQKTPASATVTATSGCTYISWSHADLARLTGKHDGLKQSLAALLSTDLAMKVARA